MKRNNKNLSTHELHLLEAKAYRILKQYLTTALHEYDISPVEWSLLGLLYDNSKGLRLSNVADELGVEAPFVTSLISKLMKSEFIEYQIDDQDNRIKIVTLTKKGKAFVGSTEKIMKTKIKVIQKNITTSSLHIHTEVLRQIIKNTSGENEK